jgi:hypothetical protein
LPPWDEPSSMATNLNRHLCVTPDDPLGRVEQGPHYRGFIMSATAGATYARVTDGTVVEMIALYGPPPIEARFPPDFVAACVRLTPAQIAVVRVGWTATAATGVWTFAVPAPSALTVA